MPVFAPRRSASRGPMTSIAHNLIAELEQESGAAIAVPSVYGPTADETPFPA